MKKISIYLAALVAIFSMSCQDETVIYNTAPEAVFTTSDNQYELGEPITFTDNSIPDDINTIISWHWEFGDEEKSTSDEKNPTFSYTKGGSYTVRLTVTDNNGLKATSFKNITIIDPTKAINIMWQSPLLGNIENTVSPVLSLDGSTVYAWANQSENNAYDVKLKAYNVADGNIKWEFNVNDALASSNPGGGVRLVYSSPTVGHNGDIYVTARDLRNAGAARRTFMFAIKANGELRWGHNFGLDGNINYIVPAVDAEGNIYVGHLTNSPFSVRVLDPEDGSIKRIVNSPVGIYSGISLSRSGNVYFSSTGSNGVFGFDTNGVQKFNFNSLFSSSGGGIAIDENETLYISGTTSSGGAIAAISNDGTQKWYYSTNSTIGFGGVTIDSDGTLYANGGNAIEDSNSGGIIALNNDGTLKWHFTTTENVNTCVPLIDDRGYIHFFTQNATYYIIKPDGTLFSTLSVGERCVSSPVMGNDGKLYITVENPIGVSHLVCLGSGARGYAQSAWPMFAQNPQHTGLQK